MQKIFKAVLFGTPKAKNPLIFFSFLKLIAAKFLIRCLEACSDNVLKFNERKTTFLFSLGNFDLV